MKEGFSFLKKRNKKLLSVPAPASPDRARPSVQKFFGSFFQKRTACFFLLVATAGCASPDSTFYTLQPVPGTATAQGALATARSVEVRRPGLAGYLDRSDVVLRDADYKLGLKETQRWAEPLGDMIGRVLTEDLSQRLPQSNVFGEGGAISADADVRVEVDIQRFDADATGTVTLAAQVALEAGRTHQPIATRHVVLTATPASAGAGALAATLSTLLGQLADTICGSGRGA
jgi:uncharacterized lipoprotein YmbA